MCFKEYKTKNVKSEFFNAKEIKFNCTNESIQKKLFSLFNFKFTDKDLKPYLEKYHISPKCIALNIETERMLEESGRNEIE